MKFIYLYFFFFNSNSVLKKNIPKKKKSISKKKKDNNLYYYIKLISLFSIFGLFYLSSKEIKYLMNKKKKIINIKNFTKEDNLKTIIYINNNSLKFKSDMKDISSKNILNEEMNSKRNLIQEKIINKIIFYEKFLKNLLKIDEKIKYLLINKNNQEENDFSKINLDKKMEIIQYFSKINYFFSIYRNIYNNIFKEIKFNIFLTKKTSIEINENNFLINIKQISSSINDTKSKIENILSDLKLILNQFLNKDISEIKKEEQVLLENDNKLKENVEEIEEKSFAIYFNIKKKVNNYTDIDENEIKEL